MLRGIWDEHWVDYGSLKRMHYYDIVDLFPPIPDDVPLGVVPYPKDDAPEAMLPADLGQFVE